MASIPSDVATYISSKTVPKWSSTLPVLLPERLLAGRLKEGGAHELD